MVDGGVRQEEVGERPKYISERRIEQERWRKRKREKKTRPYITRNNFVDE